MDIATQLTAPPVIADAPPVLAAAVPGPPSDAGVRIPGSAGIGRGFAVVGIYFAILMGLQGMLVIVEALVGRHGLSRNPWVLAVPMTAAMLCTAALISVLLPRHSFPALPGPAIAPRFLPGILLAAVGGWVWSVEIGNVTAMIIPMPDFIAKAFEDMVSNGHPVGAFLVLAVLAPVAEETVCRGVLLPALLRRLPPAAAVGISATVFGFMHLNPWQFFYATFIGVVSGWIMVKTRSLGACILLHAVNNALCWGVGQFLTDVDGLAAAADSRVEHFPAVILACGSVALAGGMVWIGRMGKSAGRGSAMAG